MMSSPFPLLSLPHLAVDKVLRSMEIQDLIHFTFCSSTIKRYLPCLRIPSGGYNVQLDSYESTVRMNGYSWSTSYSQRDWDYLEQASKRLALLKSLFSGRVKRLQVCPSLLWSHTSEVTDVLAVGGEKTEYDKWHVALAEEVDEESLNSLLDSVEFKKGLMLGGPKEMKTDHEKVLSVDWLRVCHTEWITMEVLRKMRNKVILLEDVYLTTEEINEFLRDLRDGKGNPNLQVITFAGTWTVPEVLEGLDIVRNENEQMCTFREQDSQRNEFLADVLKTGPSEIDEIRIKESMDFWRVDGVRCSVVFDSSDISVYVWNQGSEQRPLEGEGGPSAKRNRV